MSRIYLGLAVGLIATISNTMASDINSAEEALEFLVSASNEARRVWSLPFDERRDFDGNLTEMVCPKMSEHIFNIISEDQNLSSKLGYNVVSGPISEENIRKVIKLDRWVNIIRFDSLVVTLQKDGTCSSFYRSYSIF